MILSVVDGFMFFAIPYISKSLVGSEVEVFSHRCLRKNVGLGKGLNTNYISRDREVFFKV